MEDVYMSYKIFKPKKYTNNPMNYVGFFGVFSCDKCQCYEYWFVKRAGKTKVFYVLECKEC